MSISPEHFVEKWVVKPHLIDGSLESRISDGILDCAEIVSFFSALMIAREHGMRAAFIPFLVTIGAYALNIKND